jgi:hypothetical protein
LNLKAEFEGGSSNLVTGA